MHASERSRAQAVEWCEALWGDRVGWAITALGREPYLKAGRLQHARFEQRHYRWPEDRERLLIELLPQAPRWDVYASPLLRSKPNRREADSEPLDGQHVWLDADEWDDQRERVLAALGAPVMRVASGGAPERLHLYVDLGELLPGRTVADMAKLLTEDCRTDTYGGSGKLLRLPGTLNHKPRLQGMDAGHVVIL